METKKPTKAQIERKIQNAIVFVPKDKETKTIFFTDKGLRLTTTMDSAVIETGYHRHVFSMYTASGVSRPYLYTRRLIEMALENNCVDGDGYSFQALLRALKEKEDKTEFNLTTYIEWWLQNIFHPLYTIGESEIESFLVFEEFIHNTAVYSIILNQHNEDMTNKQFLENVKSIMDELTANVDERILIAKKTDEEIENENIEAIKEQMIEQTLMEDESQNQES